MGESLMAWAMPECGGIVNGVEVILQTKTALRGKSRGGNRQTRIGQGQPIVWASFLKQIDLERQALLVQEQE